MIFRPALPAPYRLLDFISVLSYDLHGSWEKVTGHNSPLFSLPGDPKSSVRKGKLSGSPDMHPQARPVALGNKEGLCSSSLQAYAMNYWRQLGVPPEKLLMGLPTYGRTFHLLRASQNELRAEAVGPASPGKYTKQAGFLAYYEVTGMGTSVCELGLPNLSPGPKQGQGTKARLRARDWTRRWFAAVRDIHSLGCSLFFWGSYLSPL